MTTRRSAFATLLAAALLLTAAANVRADDPVINEFMADNHSTITDQNGDYSDWIEIRNPGPGPVNLEGWFLTDTKVNKSKWRFPSVTVPANGFLTVFASGKDRAISGQQLHTNFQLSSSGEYLALVKPDGATATTAFDPQYPAQLEDVSYGAAKQVQSVTWIDRSTPARGFVPTDESLGTTWRDVAFNDNAWLSGTLGAGYFLSATPDLTAYVGLTLPMQNVSTSAFIRVPFTVPDVSKVSKLTLRISYDDGFAAFVNGQFVQIKGTTLNSLSVQSTASPSHGPGPTAPAVPAFEDFDISAAISSLASGGSNVLAIHLLNASIGSSDAFVLPQVIAEVATQGTPQIGYFTTATPGAGNGAPSTLRIPQVVGFSQPSGNFTTAFSLALSGANAGSEIRYVTATTSATATTLAEPTATSTLYNPAAPIPISASTLIRAAIFDPVTGQRSVSRTAQYLLLETAAGANNTSAFTSNLPILVADDHGAGVPIDSSANTYTAGLLYVYEPVNGVAKLNIAPNRFTRAGYRVRGSSSQGFAKQSYAMELWDEKNMDLDQPLLGLASDSDWILNGPYLFDDTFIHNAYTYEISRRMGRWASRTQPVELFFNQNGGKLDYSDYAGIYILTEKIKSSKNRLDIVPLQPTDNAGDAVTGGYIFKIDRGESTEVTWHTTNGVPHGAGDEYLIIGEPDPDFDTPQQINYLKGYVQQFDTAVYAEAAANFSTRNYRNFIDVGSFVDHHIINSLTYNVDALRLSAFYFKDRLGKINAGPAWDFDRALASDDSRDDSPASWGNIDYFFSLDWWGRLFKDPDFVQAWVDRYWLLRQPGSVFDLANLNTLADQMGAQIGNAAGARDAAKWPENAARGGVYLNEITDMKTWLTTRVNWLDTQVPAPPVATTASGVVNSGQTVTLSGTGALRYTINGADPRPPGGAAASTALTYSGPIALTQTTVLTARRQTTVTPFPGGAVPINWSAPLTRVYLVNETFAAAGDIAVSEINYNPLAPTAAELAAIPSVMADDFEWIELRNVGTRKVNLFEVKFADGQPATELKLAPLSLSPGEFALVVKNRAAFEARYGTALSSRIVGEWGEGSLDNNGEAIRILARDGTEIQNFIYSDAGAWPGRADGKGSTLEYAGTTYSNADYTDGANWRASSEIQGSPAVAGAGVDGRVVINEVLSFSTLPRVDAIELLNTTGTPVDISGWYLSDRGSVELLTDYAQYRIPANTVIPANGYLVFTEAQFNPNGAWNPGAGTPAATEFAFDASHGDDAWLIQADGTGKPLKFVDHVDFGASRPDESWGRWPNGTGKLYPMLARTLLDEASPNTPRPGLGAPNSTPHFGPVIINEIQHSPGGSTDLEFIELRNAGTVSESLARWTLRGSVDFDFSSADVIARGGVLVVVPFAPSDSAKATAFRNAYGLASNVPLAGPWSANDHLGATGQVTLYRAGTPPQLEPGFYPQLWEDEVNYASTAPWPTATGTTSLNRIGSSAVGDLPASWTASLASPGEIPSTGGPNTTFAAWKSQFFPTGGAGSGDAEDPDGDGISNANEYANATNPRVSDFHPEAQPTFELQDVGGVS